MIPDLIPLPYKIGIALCFAAVIAFGAYYKGYNNANAKYIAVKVQLDSERAQAKADADQARVESERVTKDVSLAWSAALVHLRDHPAIRVLRTPSDLPHANAGGTPGLNVRPTPNPVDPTAITAAECEALINDGILDSAQLAWLQHWIRSQQ